MVILKRAVTTVKRNSFMEVLLALSAALSLFCSPCAASEGKVVARVGDAEITEADLEDAISRHVPPGTLHAKVDPARRDEYRKAALKDLIETELLYREALQKGVNVSDEAIQKVVEKNIKRYGSEGELKKALEQRGLTMKGFKQKIRKFEMVSVLLKRLDAESAPSDEEVRSYYDGNQSKYRRPEAVHIRHILIKVEATAPEEEWEKQKEFAEGLLKRIKSGEDFGAVAGKHSDDPYRVKGGEIGYVHKGRLAPRDLEDAAFSLGKDEVSGVIRTIYGFHILKAGEKKPAEAVPFDEVKDKIKREIEKERFDEKKEATLARLRKEYPVTIVEEGKSP